MQNIIRIALLTFLIINPKHVWASNSNFLHTHTNTPIELELVSSLSGSEIKLAAVCFLGMGGCGDGGFASGGDDMNLDTINKCLQEGYNKTTCALPAYLTEVCPYNELYFAKCETDKARACDEAGFVASCGLGQVAETSCPYDSSFKKCKCNPCAGYDYTSAQATAQGYVADGSCQSCAVVKYKRKLNPCSGYNSCECGGEIGASVCYSGTVKKFNKCKTCCENRCTLTACPANTICTYEACSNRYCGTGCATNYTNWCTQPVTDCGTLGYSKTVADCPNGYLKCPYGAAVFCPFVRPSCQIGWIYYSDNTCNVNVIAGKTALGVVVYVNPDGIGGQVLATTTVGSLDYGYGRDIPSLPNYVTRESAAQDFNSCGNTDVIVAYGNSSSYPAAHATRNYAPTPETKGKWCLPAAGVMSSLHYNKSAVQAGMAKLGGATVAGCTGCYTWSSTEKDYYQAWSYYYGLESLDKYHNGVSYNNVRPVLEF